MTVKISGIPITLGDRKLVMPPLNFRALKELQTRLGKVDMATMDDQTMSLAVDVAMAALKRNYDDVTEEFLLEYLDVANMQEVFEAAMDVSGLKRKKLEQAGRSDDPPSTGTSASAS